MRGLVIREPWAGLILRGEKDWEMRSHGTSVRGPIAVIARGTGHVAGVVDLVGVKPRLAAEELAAHVKRHRIPLTQQDAAAAAGWLVPWELVQPRQLVHPVAYAHPSGAVIWVQLEAEVTAAIKAQLDVDAVSAATPRPTPHTTMPVPPAENLRAAVVRLTEANRRHGHIYLRTARHLFRAAHIGGSSKADLAPQSITVELGSAGVITTDIAGDKMILRARGAVRAFLEDAMAGDGVRIERLESDRFRFTLVR